MEIIEEMAIEALVYALDLSGSEWWITEQLYAQMLGWA
jgi:hypothetical protein